MRQAWTQEEQESFREAAASAGRKYGASFEQAIFDAMREAEDPIEERELGESGA